MRKYCSPYAGGSDSSGYLNAARLLLEEKFITAVPPIEGLSLPAWNPHFQQPLGFHVDQATGSLIPSYAIGLPLHLILASVFVELDYAAILVNAALVVAAGGLMVAMARRFGLPWAWSLASAALLWASPLYVMSALQPMSDHPSLVWVTAAIWLSLKSRDRWPWAFAAGFAVAVAVLVRPTNLFVMLPVAVALAPQWRAWIALASGGLPGAVFLGWLNFSLWGSPFRTGYGTITELLSPAYVPHNALHFALWLFLLLSPPVALAALGLPWLRRSSPLFTRVVVGWCAAFVGFYLFYFHSGELWWYLRFILPMFPAMILAGVLVAHHAFQQPFALRLQRWLPAALLVVALGWEVTLCRRLNVHHLKRVDMAYPLSAEWAKKNLPRNAILLQFQASGAFTYYTDFTVVRWDLLDADTSWPLLQNAARAAHRPIYATLFDYETTPALELKIPGSWQRIAQVRHMEIWQLAEASPVVP